MIPVALKLAGFLSYREPVTIDFTNFRLAAISGQNGAGKSSLLDAITWALFGQARRRDDAIIHTAADSAEVTFDFEYEGQRYRIIRIKPRGKTTMLEFYLLGENGWKPLTEHSLRETENRLETILRLDYDTFTNASFFLQGKADQFAQQRPGDRKRILSNILGLEVWEMYREETASRRRKQENDLLNLDGQLHEIQSELNEEDFRRQRLAQLQNELTQLTTLLKKQEDSLDNLRMLARALEEQRKMVDMLARQMESSRARLQGYESQLEQRKAEQSSYEHLLASAEEIEDAYRQWQADRVELERWNELRASYSQQEQARSAPLMTIASERSRLEQEQRGGLEQRSQVQSQAAKLPEVEEQIADAQARITDINQQLQQREALQQEEQSLQQAQAEMRAENKKLYTEMNALAARIKKIEDVEGSACPVCGQPLSPEDRENMIVGLRKEGKALGDLFRQNESEVAAADAHMKDIKSRLAEFKQQDSELRAQEQRLTQLQARHEHVSSQAAAWNDGGELRLREVERILTSEDFAHEARRTLLELDASLVELGYDIAAHEEARRKEQAGRSSEERMQALHAARAALAPLEREITNLEDQVRTARSEASISETDHRTAAEKYQQDVNSLPNMEEAEDELFQLKTQENQLRLQVGQAQQAVEVLKNLRKRQAELNKRCAEIKALIARLKSLERAFSKDGIPALLIEQALPEIEEQANDILDRLTDGMMSVHFDTQRQYRDKSREDKKETLDIIITDSSGPREYEMFSGGEAFRINFAIRLALSRVLAQRAGSRLQTLVIDEGFGSQDAAGRQRLLEAINLVKQDFEKILIITHLEELKEAFPARIEIEKGPYGSHVQVVNQ